jgi:transcription elongation factor GreA
VNVLPMNEFEDVVVTADGYAELRAELEALRSDGRRELSERVREARSDGDLDDNPVLYDVLEEQAQLERRIAMLKAQVAAARVVEPAADGTAGIGSYVTVRDAETGEGEEYELVSAVEADLTNGRLSIGAPVGRALVGRRGGDTVEFDTPRGRRRLEILEVRTADAERGAA